MTTFYAVRGQDFSTCEELGWTWASVAPMVLARGEDEDEVMAAGVQAAGHDDVRVQEVQ